MNDSSIIVNDNKKIKIKSNNLSLRDFYNKRNKILILRDAGGLGDILMMRMIFHDFIKIMPEAQITFAVPTNYTKACLWHPYIKQIENSKTVDENKFGITYNLTTACVKYEMKIRPRADRHRAEIWTTYCGIQLTSSNMHLNIPPVIKKYVENKLFKIMPDKGKGYVCFCPMSNMISKDLDIDQIKGVINGVKSMGYSIFILHNKSINVECPVIFEPLEEWLSFIDLSDYVITVDTAAFHAANGFNKPTVAIFSWADGIVYTKFHNKCKLVQKHRDFDSNWTCGPCYDHPRCPKTSNPRKPCITNITIEEILDSFKDITNSKKILKVINSY